MDMQVLTDFFMWCSIINGSIFLIWIIVYGLAPNLVYKIQGLWFLGSRETFNTLMYALLGLFKLFFLIFNLTPYLALLLMT